MSIFWQVGAVFLTIELSAIAAGVWIGLRLGQLLVDVVDDSWKKGKFRYLAQRKC